MTGLQFIRAAVFLCMDLWIVSSVSYKYRMDVKWDTETDTALIIVVL